MFHVFVWFRAVNSLRTCLVSEYFTNWFWIWVTNQIIFYLPIVIKHSKDGRRWFYDGKGISGKRAFSFREEILFGLHPLFLKNLPTCAQACVCEPQWPPPQSVKVGTRSSLPLASPVSWMSLHESNHGKLLTKPVSSGKKNQELKTEFLF